MAKGYWVGRFDVIDDVAYKAYIAANAGPIAAFGGKFLVRGGDFEEIEGQSRLRNVVLEFESYEAAKTCYHSDAYQEVLRLRKNACTNEMIIVEGYDGPQPDDAF